MVSVNVKPHVSRRRQAQQISCNEKDRRWVYSTFLVSPAWHNFCITTWNWFAMTCYNPLWDWRKEEGRRRGCMGERRWRAFLECDILNVNKGKKSETELTASVLKKKRSKTQKKGQKERFLIGQDNFLCFFLPSVVVCLSSLTWRRLSVESACLFLSSFVVHWWVQFPSPFS